MNGFGGNPFYENIISLLIEHTKRRSKNGGMNKSLEIYHFRITIVFISIVKLLDLEMVENEGVMERQKQD